MFELKWFSIAHFDKKLNKLSFGPPYTQLYTHASSNCSDKNTHIYTHTYVTMLVFRDPENPNANVKLNLQVVIP